MRISMWFVYLSLCPPAQNGLLLEHRIVSGQWNPEKMPVEMQLHSTKIPAEIEATEAMIEAGLRVLEAAYIVDDLLPADRTTVVRIFHAMYSARHRQVLPENAGRQKC